MSEIFSDLPTQSTCPSEDKSKLLDSFSSQDLDEADYACGSNEAPYDSTLD